VLKISPKLTGNAQIKILPPFLKKLIKGSKKFWGIPKKFTELEGK